MSAGANARQPDCSGKVGTSLKKYKANDLVLGDFNYVDDITVPGMSYAAMKFTEHPRALVKGIDASAALEMEGVERVITAANVPGNRYVGLILSDWPILVAIGEETRCVGDIVAIVVVRDQYLARKAAERVVVDYEVRTPISTTDEALKPDAPKFIPRGICFPRAPSCAAIQTKRLPTRRTWWKTRFRRSASSTCFWSRSRALQCRSPTRPRTAAMATAR